MTCVPAARPCGSCPYRRDVPSGVWDEEEYAKLPDYDVEQTALQPPAAFMCHQQDGRLCAGWVAVHDMRENLGLRLVASMNGLSEDDFSVIVDYETDVPLFASGEEAAAHGRADIEAPGPPARRLIERLGTKGSR